MKTQLLAIALLLISYSTSFASHLMGGQITSRNIGGLTYEVTLTLYRDILGIPMPVPLSLFYTHANNTTLVDHTVMPNPLTGVNIGNGVEEYTFVDVMTFPAAGTYHIWFAQCCRNAAILNTANPGSNGMYLNNTLLVDSTNSSPVFLNPPIPIAQLNTPFVYNPLPFDGDGDSIVWALATPQDNPTLSSPPSPFDVTGYTLPSSDTAMPFTMNPLTGEITFLPNLDGHFVASFLVSEYRGGVLIGEIRRDMQIIVVPSPNSPVIASATSNTFPYTGRNFNINIGTTFTLNVSGTDPDNSIVTMLADGAPFHTVTNPATFTSLFQSL